MEIQKITNTEFNNRLKKRLYNLASLDFHVFSTLVLRFWGIVAGGLTILLLPICINPNQQGYYYTFASLLALQVFFELGFNQIIIQLISREAAHIVLLADGTLKGETKHLNRLAGIVALLRRWYYFASLFFAVIISIAGWFFLRGNTQSLPNFNWGLVWVVLVGLSSINLFLSPQLSVIEGIGRVGQVARLRLFISFFGSICMWFLLFFGAELWAALAVPFISAIATFLWLRSYNNLLKISEEPEQSINWKQEIFPMQWRIAVSWVCGYFILNLFTPVIFFYHGPIEAGRVGMALSVYGAITTLGLSWITAKVPNLTMHVSRGEFESLNRLFNKIVLRSVIVTTVISFVVLGFVELAKFEGINLSQRVAPTSTIFWIACAAIVNTIVHAAATYMRSNLEEPMLPVSITSGLLTLLVVILFRENVSKMMMWYSMIGLCITLPWTLLLFQVYRKRNV